MGQELQGTGGLRKVERVQGIREAELFQPIDKGSMQGSSQGEGPEVKCTQGEVGCRMIILLVHRAPPSSSASIFLGNGKRRCWILSSNSSFSRFSLSPFFC